MVGTTPCCRRAPGIVRRHSVALVVAGAVALAGAGCSKDEKAAPPVGAASVMAPAAPVTTTSPVVATAASVVAPRAPSAAQVLPPPGGNAASGMPTRAELLPLASPGTACAPCNFNGRCALLTTGSQKQPCCDYANGKTPDAWPEETGHAAECLAMIVGAPSSPAPAKGKLLPLARPGEVCRACFFNGRCALLVDGSASDKLPCCDYAHGTKSGEWRDDTDAARCLAAEASARP